MSSASHVYAACMFIQNNKHKVLESRQIPFICKIKMTLLLPVFSDGTATRCIFLFQKRSKSGELAQSPMQRGSEFGWALPSWLLANHGAACPVFLGSYYGSTPASPLCIVSLDIHCRDSEPSAISAWPSLKFWLMLS